MDSSNDTSSTSPSAVVIDSKVFKCRYCPNFCTSISYVLHCGHSFCLHRIENARNAAIERQETIFKCPACSYTQDVNSKLRKNYAFCSISHHIKSTKDFILQSPEYKKLQKYIDHQKTQNPSLIEASTVPVSAAESVINAQKEEISQLKDENDSLKNRLINEEKKASNLQDALDREKKLSASIRVKKR